MDDGTSTISHDFNSHSLSLSILAFVIHFKNNTYLFIKIKN